MDATEEFVANLIANGRCWDEDTRSLDELLDALGKRFSTPDKQAKDRIPLGQILKSGVLACQPVQVKPFDGAGIEISGRVAFRTPPYPQAGLSHPLPYLAPCQCNARLASGRTTAQQNL